MNIKIDLLSPAIIGNGEGWGSIIDLDVIYDDLGIPFIPARRIKGVLRESSIEIIEMLRLSGLDIFSRSDIDTVFGKIGTKTSKCTISNFYLRNYENYREWIIWGFDNYPEIFSRERIKNLFTVFRSQTSINEKGVAKQNSLRSERALKKGLEFVGKITFPSDVEDHDKYICLLVLSMRNTKRIGTNRNRGFGKVKFGIPKEFEDKAKKFLEQKGAKIKV